MALVKSKELGVAEETVLSRMEWWIHLIKTDGRNWRLLNEGNCLMHDMKGLGLFTDANNRFARVLKYNSLFFDDVPDAHYVAWRKRCI